MLIIPQKLLSIIIKNMLNIFLILWKSYEGANFTHDTDQQDCDNEYHFDDNDQHSLINHNNKSQLFLISTKEYEEILVDENIIVVNDNNFFY